MLYLYNTVGFIGALAAKFVFYRKGSGKIARLCKSTFLALPFFKAGSIGKVAAYRSSIAKIPGKFSDVFAYGICSIGKSSLGRNNAVFAAVFGTGNKLWFWRGPGLRGKA